jgi:hypothetical protein
VSNIKEIMNDRSKRMWKEVIIYFKMSSQNSAAETEKLHQFPGQELNLCHLEYEAGVLYTVGYI